ncbi:MAG TPA: SDR family NAD(P)-dependent oxidoreductase [Solirubrobacteraceae bacterium]|nr:SDR family NAD(P)-dependent oxidoreductase [Solirubrobacteraceae bacterium]
MKIDGSAALVAGGASGLGEATARQLHARGASVVIADLNADRGQALVDELGSSAQFVRADVSDPDAVAGAVDAAAALPGGVRIAICCAGIGWAERVAGRRGAHALEPFETVIGVNLIGTFNVLRLASAAMLATEPTESGERGVCINTASIAAFDGQIGQIAYSASKGAIVGTVRFPQRLGRPQEYAALAVHIVENEMLNGEVIRLDGALRMPPR